MKIRIDEGQTIPVNPSLLKFVTMYYSELFSGIESLMSGKIDSSNRFSKQMMLARW